MRAKPCSMVRMARVEAVVVLQHLVAQAVDPPVQLVAQAVDPPVQFVAQAVDPPVQLDVQLLDPRCQFGAHAADFDLDVGDSVYNQAAECDSGCEDGADDDLRVRRHQV